MGDVCEKHNVKLLTYGTLVSPVNLTNVPVADLRSSPSTAEQCGGFLSDRWLNKPEPDAYDGKMTPSQRKVSIFSSLSRMMGAEKYFFQRHC
jgi:hypothetical protein